MKATKKVPRHERGRKPARHGAKGHRMSAELRRLMLEIEPATHRLGDGIEALQVAGTAADAIAPAAVAWFAETLHADLTALRRTLDDIGARLGLRRRRR
jgi:hypothetical protein